MSQNHRYKLEPYKGIASRHTCPACNEKKKFSRYIDTATNGQLDDNCGRCEKVDSCGNHLTPSDFFKDNPTNKPLDFEKWKPLPTPPPRPISFIDNSVFKQSLGLNNSNTFTNFLMAIFGKERAEMLVDKYHIGTTKNAETIFYQVDLQGNVRSGKVMKYNITDSTQTAMGKDCKRNKTTFPNWVHSKLKLENFNLCQCLFGEHLINDGKTIAVVESEKSAIIASVYFTNFVWVASGGKEGLSIEKLQVLKNKSVILFPDLGGFDKWTAKAKELTFCKSVVVSDLLEQMATMDERASGLDLADYLLRLPPPAETLPAVATKPEPSSTVTTDTQSCIVLENDGVVIHDLIEDVPFWEEIPQISDVDFKRNCEVLDWWNKRLDLPIDGTMNIDGVTVHDIKEVITKHLKIIHSDNSSAVLSLKFLEKIKKSIT